VLDRDIAASKANRKSYMVYRMAPSPVIFNDLENHFCCLKPF